MLEQISSFASPLPENVVDAEIALLEAVKQNDINKTKEILNQFPNININIQEMHNGMVGWIPLIWAAHNRNLEMVNLLLSNEANPNIYDTLHTTALMAAGCSGNYEIAKALINAKADINIQTFQLCGKRYKETALMFAIDSGHYKIVELLIKKGVDTNIATSKGETALTKLILQEIIGAEEEKEQLNIIKKLIEGGAEINRFIKEIGATALLIATDIKNKQIVNLLLSQGANPNIQDYYKRTSLILASATTSIEILKSLLEYGADPSIKDNYGKTALDYTNDESIKLLIKKFCKYREAQKKTPSSLANLIAQKIKNGVEGNPHFSQFARVYNQQQSKLSEDAKHLINNTMPLLFTKSVTFCNPSKSTFRSWVDSIECPQEMKSITLQ